MSGTVAVTIVPRAEIANVMVLIPVFSNGRQWALRLQSVSLAGFPESVTSPDWSVGEGRSQSELSL